MNINSIFKKWSSVLLVAVILVGVVIITIPVDDVYAESNTTPTATPEPLGTGAGNFSKAILERTHKFQTRVIEILNYQLQNAGKIEAKAQQRITELKQQGKVVSSLEEMLSKFYDLMASAKQAKDKASATLNLHRGFDVQGKVIDLKLARETTKSVVASIGLCRENIVHAHRIIANGLKVYKQQNSPQPAISAN